MKSLRVTEMFYSLQGEGKRQGIPSVFVRLWGCNLHCGYERVNGKWRKDTRFWQCDSLSSWMYGKEQATVYTKASDLYKAISKLVPKTADRRNVDIVFTGGEPLLFAADPLFHKFLYELWIHYGFIYFETNGTRNPYDLFPDFTLQLVHFGCSPKLKSSGNVKARRYSWDALRAIANDDYSFFKFVITCEEDLEEVLKIKKTIAIPASMIYLMPEGKDRRSLNKTSIMTAEMCKQFGFNYSDRLHIRIWNKATGV